MHLLIYVLFKLSNLEIRQMFYLDFIKYAIDKLNDIFLIRGEIICSFSVISFVGISL